LKPTPQTQRLRAAVGPSNAGQIAPSPADCRSQVPSGDDWVGISEARRFRRRGREGALATTVSASPAMASARIPAEELGPRIVGFAMLLGTLLLWLGSSLTVQWMSAGSAKYDKPAFLTLFNASASSLLLLPGFLNASLNIASLRRAAGLATTVGFLWTASAWVFNLSLLHTSVATNTVLSSTSSIFTFVFALLICKDDFRCRSFVSAMMCFVGCAIVASRSPATAATGAVTNTDFGDALAVLSTAMFALSSVLLRRYAPQDMDMTAYMGVTGLLAFAASPAILVVAHMAGWETFSPPPPKVLLAMMLNAAVGSAFANYLYNSSLLLVSPLVANTCLSLSIPISAYTDQVILGQHRFATSWYTGAAIVCTAVVLAASDMDCADEHDDCLDCNARREKAEDAELESLFVKARQD